ncbi:hypothetical protein GRF29_28g724519 [Pseudopithomyces chartarum]|uniref:Uncharacterized protein n=1 Tax=Pseudopithomyces chartarum TaxID=1892770 RepID=A0AAN6M2J9_9PLEO|nr:hypothetical protein GRF29_28g724519 [Pseudopithomyces chartarum]
MPSFRRLALLALPLLASVRAEEPGPTKVDNANVGYANANEAFQDLLNALPAESLRVALNTLSHFRDGVFESEKRGVEHIHRENPPLATKLIVAAVHDLKKRQAPAPSNGTVPTTQSQESQSTEGPAETSQAQPETSQPSESSQDDPQSTPAPDSSNDPAPSSSAPAPESSAVIVPVSVTTTDSQGRTTIASSEILSRPTASIVVPVTRTNAQGSTEVTSETKPAVIFSTTDSAGRTIETASAVDFAPTKGQVLTKTNAEGGTFLTTYTPGSGRVSSVVLLTTTGSDGKQSVVTSYTYVDPAQATEGASDEPSNTAKPSLQRGAAPRRRIVDAAVVGGAVAAFFV